MGEKESNLVHSRWSGLGQRAWKVHPSEKTECTGSHADGQVDVQLVYVKFSCDNFTLVSEGGRETIS